MAYPLDGIFSHSRVSYYFSEPVGVFEACVRILLIWHTLLDHSYSRNYVWVNRVFHRIFLRVKTSPDFQDPSDGLRDVMYMWGRVAIVLQITAASVLGLKVKVLVSVCCFCRFWWARSHL